jgi:phage tail-like protein
VSAFEKKLAEGTRPAYNPTVREQGAGAHDSWVSRFSEAATIDPVNISGEGREGTGAPETKAKNETSNPFKVTPGTPGQSNYSAPAGRPGQSAHDSWVNAFKKELVKGEGKSWKAAPVQSNATSGGSFSAAPVQSAPVQQDKFVGQWNFRVVIDNIPDDNCKLLSISGITMETEPIEFKRNNSNRVESIPGRIKCGNIEFTKVVNLGGDSFSQWREQIEAGDDAFRTIQVHLHHVDMSADPVMSVTLHNAWPIKWEFPELSGSSSDAAIEKITFDVSHITRN